MSRLVKLSLIVVVLIALAILLFFAVSENFFLYTVNMTYDNTVLEGNGGYELYFYTYGNKDTENSFHVATLFYDIEQDSRSFAHVTFRISPVKRFQVYSMNLDVKEFQPASALILENPANGQTLPFVYTRTDNVSSVTIDIPDTDLEYGKPITIDFWLDLRDIELNTERQLILATSFSVHDESVFKIVKYVSNVAVELDISFIVQ
jgi:hypothetical protein